MPQKEPLSPAELETARAAFNQVKATVASLRNQLNGVDEEISLLQEEIETLPKKRPPFDDLKAGLLDIMKKSGERHAEKYWRSAVIKFATGGAYSRAVQEGELGKPIPLGRLENALHCDDIYNGETFPRFINPNVNTAFELPLYALFFDIIKPAFESVMQDITPEELGYTKIQKSEIGPTRAEMRRLIAEKRTRIDELKEVRKTLVEKLAELGVKPDMNKHLVQKRAS